MWNERFSRIEMHLESECPQRVRIPAVGLDLVLARGERIHTESSVKYDMAMLDGLLSGSGYCRTHTWNDPLGQFAVHLAHTV